MGIAAYLLIYFAISAVEVYLFYVFCVKHAPEEPAWMSERRLYDLHRDHSAGGSITEVYMLNFDQPKKSEGVMDVDEAEEERRIRAYWFDEEEEAA